MAILSKWSFVEDAEKAIAGATGLLFRAKSDHITAYRVQETLWLTSRLAEYTEDSWTKYNEKWKTITVKYPEIDLDNPENIVRDNIINDTTTVTTLRKALIYKASHVLQKAQIKCNFR